MIAVILDKRTKDAPEVQEIFTRYGCVINVRLGVHEVQGCSDKGLILLVTNHNEKEVNKLVEELQSHPGVKVNKMEID